MIYYSAAFLAFHKIGPNDSVLREISTWVIFAKNDAKMVTFADFDTPNWQGQNSPKKALFCAISKITLIDIVSGECSTCVTFAKNDASMVTFCNFDNQVASGNSPQTAVFCAILKKSPLIMLFYAIFTIVQWNQIPHHFIILLCRDTWHYIYFIQQFRCTS